MTTPFFHECEAKYKIASQAVRDQMEQRVRACGFTLHDKLFESDIIPDTADFRCREQKLVLRFRRVTSANGTDVLVTLKVRGAATAFQEHFELEYYLSKPDTAIFHEINTVLQERIGLSLPAEVNSYAPAQYDALIARIKQILPAHRIQLEKLRYVYARKDCKALLDTLPEGIGDYLELEAPSPDKLQALVVELGLQQKAAEVLDYGQILVHHKAGQPEQAMRTGQFTAAERATMLAALQ